jgi:hypothetical protein
VNPYYWLEDKWYSLLEKIDTKVPVLWITDKIDSVIPSFALFILLLIVLLLAGAFIISSGPLTKEQVTLTVLTVQDAPIQGAIISITQSCAGTKTISLPTNDEGKITFTACQNIIEFSITKEGYETTSGRISIDEKEKIIRLAQGQLPPARLTVKIVNNNGTIIQDAKLTLICIKDGSPQKTPINPSTKQPSTGLNVIIPEGCDFAQLNATAVGYKEETINVTPNSTSLKITLDEEAQKGSVEFQITSPIGVVNGAQIIINDEMNNESIRTSDETGSAIFSNINSGEYTYIVNIYGITKSGVFDLKATEYLDLNIFLEDYNGPPNPKVFDFNAITLKVLDNNSIKPGVEVKLFSISHDGNTLHFASRTTKVDGTTDPIIITDTNKTYKAILYYPGYKYKLITPTIRLQSLGPETVQLEQGGTTIKVIVIDDENKLVTDGVVNIYSPDLNAPFYTANQLTDANGSALLKYLPDGTYRVDAMTHNQKGSTTTIIEGVAKEIQVKVAYRLGDIKFNLYNATNTTTKITPECVFYKMDTNGAYIKLGIGDSSTGTCTTQKLLAETRIKLIINDSDYLAYESPVLAIRGDKTKTIDVYLRKKSELPNQNQTQLILRKIYPSNPLDGIIQSVNLSPMRLSKGNTYYFAFDLITNAAEEGSTIANFYVSPQDKLTIQADSNIFLQDALTVDNAVTTKTDTMTNAFYIVQSNATIKQDYPKAKQINVIVKNVTGPRVIPIVLALQTDQNAKGTVSLYYQSKFNTYTGLFQQKDFIIGTDFCFKDTQTECPTFLIANELKWPDENSPYEVLDTTQNNPQILQLGNKYWIRTIVRNNTDTNFGESILTEEISNTITHPNDFDYIEFYQAKSSVNADIYLAPLGNSSPQEFQLTAKKNSTGKVKVTQKITDPSGVNNLEAKGTKPIIYFEVKEKENLGIKISAAGFENTLFAGEVYNQVFIKTYYLNNDGKTPKQYVPSKVIIQIEGENSSREILTDANGFAKISLDLTNVPIGKKISFTASNKYTIGTKLEIKTTDIFATSQPKTKCLVVAIPTPSGPSIDISTMTDPTLNITINNSNDTNSFKVRVKNEVSDCNKSYHLTLSTNTTLSDNQTTGLMFSPYTEFDLLPNGAYNQITVNPKQAVISNGGLLGIYQVKIEAYESDSENPKSELVATLDVFVNDANTSRSCFTLDNAVYDLSTGEFDSGKIINHCSTQRYDALYPKLRLDIDSAKADYSKEALPPAFEMPIAVVGSAIESVVGCGAIFSNTYADAGGGVMPVVMGKETYIQDSLSTKLKTLCEEMFYDGAYTEKKEPTASTQPVEETKKNSANLLTYEYTSVGAYNHAYEGYQIGPTSYGDFTSRPDALAQEYGIKVNPSTGYLYVDSTTAQGNSLNQTWNYFVRNYPSPTYPFCPTCTWISKTTSLGCTCDSDFASLCNTCSTLSCGAGIFGISNYCFKTQSYSDSTFLSLCTSQRANSAATCQSCADIRMFCQSAQYGQLNNTFCSNPNYGWGYCTKAIAQGNTANNTIYSFCSGCLDKQVTTQECVPTPSNCKCGPMGCAQLTAQKYGGASWTSPVGFPFGLGSPSMTNGTLSLLTGISDAYGSGYVSFFGAGINLPEFNPPVKSTLVPSTTGLTQEEKNLLTSNLWSGTYNQDAAEFLTLSGYATFANASALGNGNYFLKLGNPNNGGSSTNTFEFQLGLLRKKELMAERRGLFHSTININPTSEEETTMDYKQSGNSATPIAQWTTDSSLAWNSTTASGLKAELNQNIQILSSYDIFKVLEIKQQKSSDYYSSTSGRFVNPERTQNASASTAWTIRDASDDLVEYDSKGKIMYYIPSSYANAYPGVKLSLKNGKVHALYVGEATPNPTGVIDFNIININLAGEKYAQLTVTDWINSSTKQTRSFIVKLKGGPSSCYLPDGTAGYTGKQFSPKVLLNWDWNTIKVNECDMNNKDYHYCDSTQFTISLFKRLSQIKSALEQPIQRDTNLPKLLTFYAYLMKDAYSQQFLEDFDNTYSFLSSDQSYASSAEGLRELIKDSTGSSRLTFIQRDAQNNIVEDSKLTKAGLYKVDIDLNFDNPDFEQLFLQGEPSARVRVIMKFIKSPTNDNPFYSTPFDGLVGSNGGGIRHGYGTSITINNSAGMVPQNSNALIQSSFTGAYVNLDVNSTRDLEKLSNGIVVSYMRNSDNGTISLNSSKPAPVILIIKGDPEHPNVLFAYTPQSYPALAKTWKLVDSDISESRCIDFDGKENGTYTDAFYSGARKLLWESTRPGKEILVGTALYAPQSSNSVSMILQGDSGQATIIGPTTQGQQTSAQIANYTGGEYYGSLGEIFSAIDSNKMCISSEGQNKVRIWWNPSYVDKLIRNLLTKNNYSISAICSGD